MALCADAGVGSPGNQSLAEGTAQQKDSDDGKARIVLPAPTGRRLMNIKHIPTRTLWPVSGMRAVDIIDQTALPHDYRILRLATLKDAAHAIRVMQVRGAPLIGVTAAYGVALALAHHADDSTLALAVATLATTRPTAVNLNWALARMQSLLLPLRPAERADAAWQEAAEMAAEEVVHCRRIGENGLELLRPIAEKNGKLELMTHGNAGRLASVDYGTALAPIYAAAEAGIDVHVWVSETRPRNQGLLTAWELRQHGVAHTLFADNVAGLLLTGQGAATIDAVIVGADRIAANGDVANKVGTYLKALAARAAGVPFYVAAPLSTLDLACASGAQIPIEERDGDELRVLHGRPIGHSPAGEMERLRQLPADEAVYNPACDLTPAHLVTAIITERGVAAADGLRRLYPDLRHDAITACAEPVGGFAALLYNAHRNA
jgi:methylthioribose-1-phosphate isomerase